MLTIPSLQQFFRNYANPDVLGQDCLRLMYLADWRHCIEYGETLTSFSQWAKLDPWHVSVAFLQAKTMPTYSKRELATLDHVVGTASRKTPAELKKLVASTYPMLYGEVGLLDLPALAKIYVEEVRPALK